MNPTKRKFANSFARQYLKDFKIKMYCGEDRVLAPIKKLYDVNLPNTRFYVGEHFIEQGETKKIHSYEELRDMGFTVVSYPVTADTRWDYNQKVMYVLRKLKETGDHLGKIPKDHYVEYDSFNKAVRLHGNRSGPLGVGHWVRVEKSKRGFRVGAGRKMDFRNIRNHAEAMINKRYLKLRNQKEKPKEVLIQEAAFMITDANEIVCLPNLPDMPTILITGMRGSGKSFTLHSLVSRLFWKPEYNYNIAILNDSSRETGSWSTPNNDTRQIQTLGRLNEKPLPLPCVYLHPLVKEEYDKMFMNDVGFDITIPFKEVIKNHKEYLNLKESSRYFTKLVESLLNCKDQNEAEQIMDQMTITHKVPPNTANKIRAELDTLFDSKMTDISTKGQKMWWTSKNPGHKYNPVSACIRAGLLPILQTGYVSSYKELLSIYFTYFVKDIFIRQKYDENFTAEKAETLLVIDEAHNISQKGFNTGADKLLRRCIQEGRPRRLGAIIGTQKFYQLPDVIKDNSTYIICFKNPGEATQIANQYNMGKHAASIIKDLGKHQCLAYTTDHFIIYDNDGNRRKSKLNEIFVGSTLPPYSMHKRPKAEENINDK